MKRLSLTFMIIFLAAALFAQEKLTNYVDPHIGSAGHGHVFVGASVPFGAVQLGPSNVFGGWDWCSGYNYVSNTITGFSHTHLSGTGIGDLNDILMMPATGPLTNDYVSLFSHDQEISKAGYYSVLLQKHKIRAELTATERVGFHRYTFPKGSRDPHVMLDLAAGLGWDKPVDTYVKLLNPSTLVGYRFSKGWADDQRLFFAIKLSQPIKDLVLYDSTVVKQAKNGKLP